MTVDFADVSLSNWSAAPAAPGWPAILTPIARATSTLARISEEKGSDVNLATLLVDDAFREDFDQAVVISDDSDLVLPIEIVVNELGRAVGVLNPQQKPLDPKHPRASELQAVASFYRVLRLGPIQGSQFPDELTDAVGTFNMAPELVSRGGWSMKKLRPPGGDLAALPPKR